MLENKTAKKLKIISIVIIIGLALALLTIIVKSVCNQPVYIFEKLYYFTDFTDILEYSAGKAPEGSHANYFPFAYLIMRIFEFLSFGNYLLIYFIVFAACVIICMWLCKKMLDGKMSKTDLFFNIVCLVILPFPMIYAFQRGNIEMISLLFCFIFYYLFRKEKYTASAIFLAMATCLKLYPALLALLFLNRKQYKQFFLCAGATIGITAISFLLMQDVLGGITEYIAGFTSFMNTHGNGLQGMQFNHSILFGIYYVLFEFFGIGLKELFSGPIMSIYTICIAITSLSLVVYAFVAKIPEWKKLTLYTLMIASFPYVTFEYTLVFLLLPIIAFALDDTTKKWENMTYSILFGLLLIPMKIGEKLIYNFLVPNYGMFIKPIIIIVIMVLIVATSNSKTLQEGEKIDEA